MKKTILCTMAAIAALFFSLTIMAQTRNELPKNAQTLINNHFKGYTISHIEKERDILDVEYKVYLSNNKNTYKLEFDKNGHTKSIESVDNSTSLPMSVIPIKISQYVKRKYPSAKIIEWEKNRKTQEVKLSTGLELVFNLGGKFLRIDD